METLKEISKRSHESWLKEQENDRCITLKECEELIDMKLKEAEKAKVDDLIRCLNARGIST
jgi:hypothetical protein